MVFPHCLCNLVWTGIDIYLCQTNTDRLCNYKFIKLYLFLTSGKYGHINECLGNFVFRLNSGCFIKLNQLEFFALQNLAFHTVVLEDLKANCQDIKKILSSCFFFKLRHWFCEGDFSVEFPSGLLVSENILVTTLLRDWNFFSCIY